MIELTYKHGPALAFALRAAISVSQRPRALLTALKSKNTDAILLEPDCVVASNGELLLVTTIGAPLEAVLGSSPPPLRLDLTGTAAEGIAKSAVKMTRAKVIETSGDVGVWSGPKDWDSISCGGLSSPLFPDWRAAVRKHLQQGHNAPVALDLDLLQAGTRALSIVAQKGATALVRLGARFDPLTIRLTRGELVEGLEDALLLMATRRPKDGR